MTEYQWQWMTPDKPGVWAWGGRTKERRRDIVELFWLGENARDEGWWCFLMPMPKIKPPNKKAVWRLWVVPRPGFKTEFWASWVPDGSKPENTNAIRTDKTEEREE